MKLLIVYYSHTGNNRLLAGHLGRRLGARVVEVAEKHKRTSLTIPLDMLFERHPAIRAIDASARKFDHVLLVPPLWNMAVAHPMQTAITRLKEDLGKFSFASLCGYPRPAQPVHVGGEIARRAGKVPEHVWEMYVSIQSRQRIATR